MQGEQYDELYAQELTHWWHVGKRERIIGLLERFRPAPAAGSNGWRALDIGCGTGGFLAALARLGPAVGMDQAPEALAYCRRRGLPELIQHDLAQCPWPVADGAFDAITALDVVEHVDDDAAVVAEIARALRPGGLAVISVPSFRWLWSYWDEQLGHRRRYTKPQLTSLMGRAGLRVVWSSYAECATLPGIAGLRWWKQRRLRRGRPVGSDNAPLPPWLNGMLVRYGRMENWWARRLPLPWGTSVAAVGVKES
ncbi:MAG: class I SAM-dependent methyltransferase [Candidatus Omnitrophica bacterium]|nr:class I SAM-dependent methyltransferase [Candidatus Omnitrophota bacterium]